MKKLNRRESASLVQDDEHDGMMGYIGGAHARAPSRISMHQVLETCRDLVVWLMCRNEVPALVRLVARQDAVAGAAHRGAGAHQRPPHARLLRL